MPLNRVMDVDPDKTPSRKLSPEASGRAEGGKYQALFNLIPVAAYSCDANGFLLEFNHEAVRIWGRVPDPASPDARFCGSYKLYRPDGTFLPHSVSPVVDVLNGTVARVVEGELQVERPDGSRIVVNASIAPLHDASGRIEGAICCFHDITKRRREMDVLERTLAELRIAHDVAERAMRAKDEFLASLSHELRTPLTPALMGIGMLRADPRLPPDLVALTESIAGAIGLEARLIDDLLAVAGASKDQLELRREPVDMHALIRFAHELVRDDEKAKNINLTLELHAQAVRVNGDAARLRQALWHLLRNAIKFTPAGGTASVRSFDSGTSNDPRIMIEIQDTGVGISAEAIPAIFGPSTAAGGVTPVPATGGLGLGLVNSRRIVEAHGGRIGVHSTGVGEGTVFFLELPTLFTNEAAGAAELARRMTADHAKVDGPPSAPLRILLVEDHRSTRVAMIGMLSAEGYTVVAAASVAEALQKAAAESFDVVLSDVGLPDGTGYDLMSQLRARHGLAGIALSGFSSSKDMTRSREVGFVSHLVKPVTMDELCRVVADVGSAERRRRDVSPQ